MGGERHKIDLNELRRRMLRTELRAPVDRHPAVSPEFAETLDLLGASPRLMRALRAAPTETPPVKTASNPVNALGGEPGSETPSDEPSLRGGSIDLDEIRRLVLAAQQDQKEHVVVRREAPPKVAVGMFAGVPAYTSADDSDKKPREYAWHRHPASIAAIPVACALIGSILTIALGRADTLPQSINPRPAPVTQTVVQTPTSPGASDTPPLTPGGLAVAIRIGPGAEIAPNKWRAGSASGANADVYDDTGRQLNQDCYPTWVLKRGQTVIKTARGGTCQGNGFTMFSFQQALDTPGTYQLAVSVVTAGGAKGTATATIAVTSP